MNNCDAPKNIISEDELGYSHSAYQLAKVIKELKPKNCSYVIGLCGKWGDGKTTLINYIKKILCYSYEKNCKPELEDYKKIIENIREEEAKGVLYNSVKTHTEKINMIALISFLILICLVIITECYLFDFKAIKFNPLLLYLWFLIAGIIITIPKTGNFLIELLKQVFQFSKTLFIEKYDISKKTFEIIDFNPWLYQKNEKEMIEGFFKVIGQKIKIKDESNIDIMLQYAACILNLKLPDNVYNKRNILALKKTICEKLLEENKKYLVVIDDLDRIQGNEILNVLKTVKLLADFPNIVYLLAYDKDYLEKQLFIQNSNYLQKIVQLETKMPIISHGKMKEIFIKRMLNISVEDNAKLDRGWLAYIFDRIVYKFIKNLRDMSRFENFYSISCLMNRYIKELNLTDHFLLTILEEFDKKTYGLILQNKSLIFETPNHFELRKHCGFIKSLSEQNGFEAVLLLFRPYFQTMENIMKDMTSNARTPGDIKSDATFSEITNCLSLFQYKFPKTSGEDKYRRLCNQNHFDNYFIKDTTVSLITDFEYRSIISSISKPDEFRFAFEYTFLQNQDKYQDFCEKISRDEFFADKKAFMQLLNSILRLHDKTLIGLFDMNAFCTNILLLIAINKLISKNEMLSLILEALNETNIIQQIYWYKKLIAADIDKYFKLEHYKPFDINRLKEMINLSTAMVSDNFDDIISLLQTLRHCGLKPANFHEFTEIVLKIKGGLIKLLKTCNTPGDYKYYYKFDEIQDILLDYYINTKIENDEEFIEKHVKTILAENLNIKTNEFKGNLRLCGNAYRDVFGFINAQKRNKLEISSLIENNNFINSLNSFIRMNVFVQLDKISENKLIIKYVLKTCFEDTAYKEAIDLAIKKSIEILEIDIFKGREEEFDKINKLAENYKIVVNELLTGIN